MSRPATSTGTLRPNIVWFGEMPHHLDAISRALARADAFVAIGTSGAVYPAAGFVAAAQRRRLPTLEFNLAPADNATLFDAAVYGRAGENRAALRRPRASGRLGRGADRIGVIAPAAVR